MPFIELLQFLAVFVSQDARDANSMFGPLGVDDRYDLVLQIEIWQQADIGGYKKGIASSWIEDRNQDIVRKLQVLFAVRDSGVIHGPQGLRCPMKFDFGLGAIPTDLIATVDRDHIPSALTQVGEQGIAAINTPFLIFQTRATTRLEISVLISRDIEDQPRVLPIGGDLLIPLVLRGYRDRRLIFLVRAHRLRCHGRPPDVGQFPIARLGYLARGTRFVV